MEKLNLTKTLYPSNQYEKVINTEFSQLATPVTAPAEEVNSITNSEALIDQFFADYNQLFFQIPKTGDEKSHEALIQQSTEYVGPDLVNSDIQALIDEINSLQQQNLELNQQIIELQLSSSRT